MQQNMKEQYGMWLNTFEWKWFGTYTFSRPVSESGAEAQMRRYMRSLAPCSHRYPYSMFVKDRAKQDGRLHLHALVGGTGSLRAFCGGSGRDCTGCGEHLWRSGFSEVRTFIAGST